MEPSTLAPALLVGLSLGLVLGLLGGGGGILAIPAFIHVLGMPVDEASTTSLVVVAIGAAAGLVPHAIAGRVAWRTGALFGVLGGAGAVLGARAALVADDRLQLAGLIALIFLAASGMLREADDSSLTTMRHRIPVDPTPPARSTTVATQAPTRSLSVRVLASATGVGLVTGFFGVGGGFVAVPALMWGAGLAVRKATATGLLVIVINSAVALAARGTGYLPWPVTGELAVAAVVGALGGALLSHRVPSAMLKRAFGWLLLIIAAHEVWQLTQLY